LSLIHVADKPERYGGGLPLTEVVIPDDVLEALKGVPEAKARFDELPQSHQREYLKWVLEAKKADTRTRRVTGMIERLASGMTN